MSQGDMEDVVPKASAIIDYYPHHKYLNSWEVEGYNGDAFFSFEGKFVGDDNFVVPANFIELEERYPYYVRGWVSKRLKRTPYDVVVEDWASELSIHMRSLPDVSKWRERGFVDVVDAFNPWSCYGSGARRFFGYINRCLNNKYMTLGMKASKDAMLHVSFSLSGGELQEDQIAESFESFIHDSSAPLRDNRDKVEEVLHQRLFVDHFLTYIEDQRPDLLPTLDAIMSLDKVNEVTSALSITSSEFQKRKKVLVSLGAAFLEKSSK